jgi:hypothetical protein
MSFLTDLAMKTPVSDSPLFKLMSPAPPQRDEGEYYQEFGKFIIAYANAENSVHQLLRHLSGINEIRARLLFGGMRIGDACTRIRALLPGSRKGLKTRADIEDCLRQFDVIGLERDKMVHRNTTLEGEALAVSNHFVSKTIFGYERDLFTITHLLQMQGDCLVIALRLSHIHQPNSRKRTSKAVIGLLSGPWRYKPAPRRNKPKASIQRVAEALLRHQSPSQG